MKQNISISVDDDGPGLDPSLRAQVLQRGGTRARLQLPRV